MGARQFRCFELSTESASSQKKTKVFDELENEDLDKGFEFLKRHGPRSSSDLQQLSWQTKQLRMKSSPIYGWPQGLVEKALRCLSSDGALARKEFDWPIPLTDKYYHKWVLDMLETVWNFDVASLVMLGEPNTGKSPLGRSILMAQCRHNQQRFLLEDKPCLRCTLEVDFLRGEAGSVIMGDFLDDPEMQHVGVKILKSFLDVGLSESMAWARWGAAKWVQNQPRAVAANAYEAQVDEGESFLPTLAFKDFWEMIRPSVSDNASHADINAILKRSVFIVNTKRFVYFRKDGVNEEPVPRISMEGPDYLTPAAKELYGKFKSNEKCFPQDFETEIQKEQMWISLIMKKKLEERSPEGRDRQRLREVLWGQRERTTCLQQTEVRHGRQVEVKKEQFEEEKRQVFKKAKTWSQELQAGHMVIDLDEEVEEKTETLEQGLENLMDEELKEDEEDPFDHGHGLDWSSIVYTSLICPISFEVASLQW